jgi:formate/nitrite transporter FocA (FNT family)
MRELIGELADIDEVPGDTKLRSLIAALAAANWITLMMILLVLADLKSAQSAAEFAVLMSGLLFAVHLILTRSPRIVRGTLRLKRVIHG